MCFNMVASRKPRPKIYEKHRERKAKLWLWFCAKHNYVCVMVVPIAFRHLKDDLCVHLIKRTQNSLLLASTDEFFCQTHKQRFEDLAKSFNFKFECQTGRLPTDFIKPLQKSHKTPCTVFILVYTSFCRYGL